MEELFRYNFLKHATKQELVENPHIHSFGYAPVRFRPFTAPDSIQFEKSETLIEKIRRLVPGVVFYEHAYCFGAEYHDKVDIAAKHAKEFFTALRTVHAETPGQFIPLKLV